MKLSGGKDPTTTKLGDNWRIELPAPLTFDQLDLLSIRIFLEIEGLFQDGLDQVAFVATGDIAPQVR